MKTKINTRAVKESGETGDIVVFSYGAIGSKVYLLLTYDEKKDESAAVIVHSENKGDKVGDVWHRENAAFETLPIFRGELTMEQ